MPRTRSSSLEHPHLKFTRPSRHMTSRPSCLMITRPPRLTTTRPPRLMTPRPPRLRLGPAIPMTRSSSLGQALQNSKFLVPVDGSQQTLFRSSPAGTHRTFVRTYFQNPASPSSNFSKCSRTSTTFILGHELCLSMSTIFGLALLLFSYGFPLWKPEIQDASPAEHPSGTSIQFDFCDDDTIIRYHSFH